MHTDGVGASSEPDLQAMPTIELVPASLDQDHPLVHLASTEVGRRWRAAADQPSPAAREHARQILAVYTLIYELWVFQQARVQPALLYTDPDLPARVREVLDREPGPRQAPVGEVDPDPAPRHGRARAHLAYWVELAVFGGDGGVIAAQTRAVARLPEWLLRGLAEVAADALAALHGPWSLPAFLAHPVGKRYYRLKSPPATPTQNPLVLPGFPARAVTVSACAATDMHTVQAAIEAVIGVEIHRIASDSSRAVVAVDVAGLSSDQIAGLCADFQDLEDLLTAVLVDQHAPGQTPGVHVDRRPVPDHLISWVLDLHHDAARHGDRYPASTITAGGLRIRFVNAGHNAATARVQAGRRRGNYSPQQVSALVEILNLKSLLTIIAVLRRTGDRLADYVPLEADYLHDPTRN